MKKIFLMMLLLVTFVLSGCNTQAAVNQGENSVSGDLKISMLDIGHGDSILIQTGEQTILIDTSVTNEHAALVSELKKFSVTKIDKLILTHPHADHTGGAKMLISPSKKELAEFPYLEKISVIEVYDNGIPYGNGVYQSYVNATQKKKLHYQHLKAGDTLDFGNGVKFQVLFPPLDFVAKVNSGQFNKDDAEYNTNNGSIVGKLTYKDFSMMFTGDTEKESEAKILASNRAKNLKCDVLKSPHHGCDTSSTEDFLAAINPNYVLISSGARDKNDKAYGPPHSKTIKRYLAQGIDKKNILCTRFNGTIIVTSDGKNYSVQCEKKEDWVDKWQAEKKKRYPKTS